MTGLISPPDVSGPRLMRYCSGRYNPTNSMVFYYVVTHRLLFLHPSPLLAFPLLHLWGTKSTRILRLTIRYIHPVGQVSDYPPDEFSACCERHNFHWKYYEQGQSFHSQSIEGARLILLLLITTSLLYDGAAVHTQTS